MMLNTIALLAVVTAQIQTMPPAQGQPAAQKPPSATAVVRGHVTAADTGQPARRAQIRLTRIATGPTSGPPPMPTATTDADGNYEIAALLPGRYAATVTKTGYVDTANNGPGNNRPPLEIAEGQIVEHVDFVMSRASVIAGRVFDETGEPISNVQVAALRAQGTGEQVRFFPNGRTSSTDDLGSFRIYGLQPGDYIVQAMWRQNAPSSADALGRTGYAPTYFPGTMDAMTAQRFTLKANQSVSDVAMTLIPVATVRVSGSIVDSKGAAVTAGAVILTQQRNDGPVVNVMVNSTAPIRDGKFTFPGVAPGEYTLRRPPMNGPEGETATMDLAVGNDDISDLLVITSPPIKISGRIVIDPAAQQQLPGPPRVMLNGIGLMMGGGPGQSGTASADGRFDLSAPPGTYRLAVQTQGQWTIRSVRSGAEDVTDGLEVKAGRNVPSLEVILTDRTQTIAGTVGASADQVKGSTVIVFPADARKMKYAQRYVRVTRPAPDGRFAVQGLPPGDYCAIALDNFSPGPPPTADFLERQKTQSTTFTLLEGETRTVDLRLNSAS